ncbi:hypothetical protein SLS58_011111 [Diplodia intermedia]|uniref:F-box domain-containing protein n=1 Tax=Diplodia intermedia TaxID=856260 RepID=A0ABR3T1G3_9PEZI
MQSSYPPTLEDMPAEVLDIISDKGRLSLKDNLNLRMVSKAMHKRTWEWFRRKTVQMPRGSDDSPNTLHVQMTPSGLDSFAWGTMHPGNTTQIKNVHINVAQFNFSGLARISEDYGNILAYDELAAPLVSLSPTLTGKLRRKPSKFFEKTAGKVAKGAALSPYDRVNATIKDMLQLRYLKYRMEHAEQQRMRAAGEETKLFNEAFDRLDKLEDLFLGSWCIPLLEDDKQLTEWVPVDHPLNYMFRPNTPAHKRLVVSNQKSQLPHKQGYGCRMRTELLERVFNLLASKPRQLKTLVVQNNAADLDPTNALKHPSNEEAGLWAFCLPQTTFESLKPSLAHLRKVHLTLSSGEYTEECIVFSEEGTEDTMHVGPAGYTAKQGTEALVRFLSAMPMLETFQLAAASETLFTDDFISAALDALPPTITKVHLYDFVASVSTLCIFMANHSDSVREINFSRAYLVDESWDPVFKMMDALPALERLCFEKLWELHAEFADKLVFQPGWPARIDVFGERIYYRRRHCSLPVSAGLFDQMARWVFKEEYDSLICENTPGLFNLDARDTLAVALRAERETWPNTFLPKKMIAHVCKVFGIEEAGFQPITKPSLKAIEQSNNVFDDSEDPASPSEQHHAFPINHHQNQPFYLGSIGAAGNDYAADNEADEERYEEMNEKTNQSENDEEGHFENGEESHNVTQ